MGVIEFKNREHALACKEKSQKCIARINWIVILVGCIVPMLWLWGSATLAELLKFEMNVGLYFAVPAVFDLVLLVYTGCLESAVKILFAPFSKVIGILVLFFWIFYASFVFPIIFLFPTLVILRGKRELQETLVSAEEYLRV